MELSSSIRWWEFTVDERELAANTWLHFNYFQMLTYVNMPILLLWEGVGEKVGVEFIHFLAFLQQVQVKPLGGAKQLFLGTLQWESNEELAPFLFFILFLFPGVRGTFVYQQHTGNFPLTTSVSIPVISCLWLFASEACLPHALVGAVTVRSATCSALGCRLPDRWLFFPGKIRLC